MRRALPALRPLVDGAVALALTAVLVVALVRTTLANVSLEDLTLNVILRRRELFPDLVPELAIATALGRSATLVLPALAIAALLGVGLGAAHALAASSRTRRLAWALGTVGAALPTFFFALVLQLAVVAVYYASGVRLLPEFGFGLDSHLVLPVLALAARPTAYLFRTSAVAFIEVRHADHVRAARAKGLAEPLVVGRHMLPNVAPAVLGGFALAARGVLSNLAIVEYIFWWKGAGLAFIHAIANADAATATPLAIAFAAAFALIGSLAAAGARVADPRIER